ncbi:serine/threonine-protein kinase [Symbioplanes lichenis]|uniref:serine/threonine-protein kinase n=1 Tax=Symbioplanes lichenis TaxID=1629072 RepID=UPI0027391639|nr:serine/threonine-protein kinase [Actinoplanes lichenis]
MSMPLSPGDPTRLGDYELLGRLGQGGMGSVYLGRGPGGARVAVKVVRPEFAGDPEFRGRFRSEVRRAQQVPPFSTAAVLDADPEHEPPYLVVEYVDGPSLSTLVRERGPLAGPALHSVAVGIATALTAIHGAGVIHRDLKPGNVLIAPGGIKVIDFGIARAFEATSRHTRTDQMVGTVAYMAPERFEPAYGTEVTAAADVFAWGAVVAYAATGRTPFGADSPAATAVRIMTQPPELTGVPGPLRELVARSLAKYPGERPSARELLDALLDTSSRPVAAVTPGPVLPPADDTVVVAPAAPSRRRLRAGAIAVGAMVLGAGGLVAGHEVGLTGGDSRTAVTTGMAETAGPAARDAATGILAGQRRFSIRLRESGRYFTMDDARQELTVGDGTGSASEFVLEPVGVDYMIRSLAGESFAGPDRCLGVQRGDDIWPVVSTACTPTPGRLFSLRDTGEQDDKGRPLYSIATEGGWLLWDEDAKRSSVTEVGEGRFADKYSLVDRGELPEAATPAPTPSRTTARAAKLVDADLSQLESFDIDLGVPVVLTSPPDAGPVRYLDAQPDGSLAYTGTSVTETDRLRIDPAQVAKRSEANRNSVVIVAASGAETCVTDVAETELRMTPCEPGRADQRWRLTPEGDSGVFSLHGAHTDVRVDDKYEIVTEGGWSAVQTIAVKQ